MRDEYGSLFSYALLIALFGSTLLVFLYLWRRGRLDLEEGPKYKMMQKEDEDD